MAARPVVFHAGWSPSGVVQVATYYWGYFEPICQNMPRNCSANIQQVIGYIESKGTYEKQLLKGKVGMLSAIQNDALVSTLRN